MSNRTGIEWTDATWNPVTGCTKVSPGCRNCYAERVDQRFCGDRHFIPWTVKAQREGGHPAVTLHPERLEQPLRWSRPRRVFVCSMSDLFHEDVPWEYIAQVFGVMAKASQHTFQVLTKRPKTAYEMLSSPFFINEVACHVPEWLDGTVMPWPLPNVHLGVSVENQRYANERIPLLLQTPAAVRWLSMEPLLSSVDLYGWLPYTDALFEIGGYKLARGCLAKQHGAIDWIVVGGESGPNARTMDLDWVRGIRDQCQAARVPLFVKQLGSVWARRTGIIGSKGGDPETWPEDLRIREFPEMVYA